MRRGLLVASGVLLFVTGACTPDADPSTLQAAPAPPADTADAAGSTTAEGGLAPDATTSSGSDAGADATMLPSYDVITKFGHQVIRSVTVHKNGAEDRTVYIEASKIALAPTSGPLPDGMRLLMQVNQGSSFVIEKVGGVWQYGTFNPNAAPAVFTTAANASCSGCHLNAAEPGVFTAGSVRRLAATHKGEEIDCPAGPGPTPCAANVYQ